MNISELNELNLGMYSQLNIIKSKIEYLAFQVHGEKIFWVKDFSIETVTTAELNFQYTVTLLYRLYWETGNDTDIKFIINKFKTYSLDLDDKFNNHFKFIRLLRQFYQHNVANTIDPQIKKGRTYITCQTWFDEKCNIDTANDEYKWNICLFHLLKDASDFLNTLHKCIEHIGDDVSRREEYIKTWIFERKRNFSNDEIDNCIREIANDMGLENTINIKNIRDNVRNLWNKYSSGMRYDKKPINELKRFIVQEIIGAKRGYPLLPEDIINKFDIAGGSSTIAFLLDKGADFYKENSFLTPDQLLKKIQEYCDRKNTNPLIFQPSSLIPSGIMMSEYGNIYLFKFTEELQSHFEDLIEKKNSNTLTLEEQAEYVSISELDRIFTLINAQLEAKSKLCPNNFVE